MLLAGRDIENIKVLQKVSVIVRRQSGDCRFEVLEV